MSWDYDSSVRSLFHIFQQYNLQHSTKSIKLRMWQAYSYILGFCIWCNSDKEICWYEMQVIAYKNIVE